MKLYDTLPIYVTRPHGANKTTVAWAAPAWLPLWSMMLGGIAIILWSAIAIIYAFVLAAQTIAGVIS